MNIWNVIVHWIHSVGFFSRESWGSHAEVPILADTIKRYGSQDWWFFPPLPSRYTVGWECADAMEKAWLCDMDACEAKGSKVVFIYCIIIVWYCIVGGWIHFYTGMHPTLFWRVWRWCPLLWAFFGWENDHTACGVGKKSEKHPSRLLLFRYQTILRLLMLPFCGSWCFKRSHFYISVHHGSQALLS